MTAWLVMTYFSWFEGEPLGVFSTPEKADAYVKSETEKRPDRKLRVQIFTVDELV